MELLAALWLPIFVMPLLALLVDCVAPIRARTTRRSLTLGIEKATEGNRDYTVIVPIYGDMSYLKNENYLRQYGARVVVATSTAETPEFYAEFYAVARRNGFRTVTAPYSTHATEGHARRQVSGTLRDTIVRHATRQVTDGYVVCIDADTRTEQSIDLLVGRFAEANLDLASVPLIPSNRTTLLARLQCHEYRMAMRLRQLMPWLVSGGCHIARAEVHKQLMNEHSLFFQGNDVELGLIASSQNYRIGHILFQVPTEVPDTFKPWWRQRAAWAGGEFRLTIVNIRHAMRHPFLFAYGALLQFGLMPARYLYLFMHPTWAIAATLGLYSLLIWALNWRNRDTALWIYPLYSALHALILMPVGCVTYFRMALKHRNFGIIARPRLRLSEPYRQAATGHSLVLDSRTVPER